ncbi:tripartite tricarboxylate transporter TctB family protein [Bradyrhizobium sp. AUGA SZCCT0240]|uniref:tripartite tricarboxylate transporter TctB family protein n=1 Tax=unclassified Bradyrhizobium TaxID=2631580 RepID=UPI001BADE9EA|nr:MULTISPECIES: tripartite tricarboxylate transporter TctB family protein [unclassified Bradyrhizobium]MBR1194195.1 tripartite tricarboxylate transporter TctB family protein [Bradyrhizobium sp. AUGA SZCCT0160]MBR1243493.1 tripartite tricarboxylate transporter TctB family protein [Bradyrhizobium sp. AUGA SZCCT0274]MBR1258388.1 tripartite tricarboxylate transporter TctB family protein [Bradyrhizobium sp. AUGA SZCCT0240]
MNAQPKPQFTWDNSELWSGAASMALGVFVIWAGANLGIGSMNDPKAGFVLFYTGMLLSLFAFSIVIAALREGGPTFSSLWADTRWTKPLIVIACLVAFCVLFEPLGFLLASIPLLLLLLRVIDPVSWMLAIPLAVTIPLGAWWVLKHALLIQLPAGIFGIG